jgi:hypothetical protein
MSEFLDFLGGANKGSVDEKIERIMETLEVLSAIVGDKLPVIMNQQIMALQQQIDQINSKIQQLQSSGGSSGGAPMPPGVGGGAPMPPGAGGAPTPPGVGGAPTPPGVGAPPPPGSPPPPPGGRPKPGAGPVSLKASIMDELKSLLAKRRTD